MAFLGRGGDGHHYECVDAENGTLMRHFLRSAFPPGALPGRMEQCTAKARLEANAGAVYRLAPADRRAVTRAVLVAAVTVGANAHLRGAPPATIESIRLPACPQCTPRAALDKAAQHWHKRKATAFHAREQWKARGSAKNRPGPSSIRRLQTGYRGTADRRRPFRSARDRSLSPWLSLIQADDTARHLPIKPETRTSARTAR